MVCFVTNSWSFPSSVTGLPTAFRGPGAGGGSVSAGEGDVRLPERGPRVETLPGNWPQILKWLSEVGQIVQTATSYKALFFNRNCSICTALGFISDAFEHNLLFSNFGTVKGFHWFL